MSSPPRFTALVACYAAQFNFAASRAHYLLGRKIEGRRAAQRGIRYLREALGAR